MDTKDLPDSNRRALLLGAGILGAGAAGAGLWQARRHGLWERLLNPFAADHFDLPALAGLTDVSGAPIPGFSSAGIAGQAVYVNAFASWCPTCREEHPALMEFARSGVKIYGVASLDEPSKTLAFLLEQGNPFVKVGVDRKGYLFRALGARGVPAHFVFAPAPKLAFAAQGPMDYAQMRERIAPLLAVPKA
jgi:DsbE subfamily thiol:disulfide oxidoreductase